MAPLDPAGRTKDPDVLEGVFQDSSYPVLLVFQLAWKGPNGVVKPASADVRSPN